MRDRALELLTEKLSTWYVSYGIAYSLKHVEGAAIYNYTATHIPTGKVFPRTIYGVSQHNGEKLINYWNTVCPNHWKFTI